MKNISFPFLFLISFIYGFLVAIDRRIRSIRRKKLKGLVFSVGNLSVGGTGKTPLVVRLTKDVISLGLKPAILSRGYRGFLKKGSRQQVLSGFFSKGENPESVPPNNEVELTPALLNDEALLMTKKLPGVPIGVGSDRIKSYEVITKNSSVDIFILDDGFQHWPIYRDCDLVCLDALDPWGGGHLFPRGRLREPLSQLKRASAIVLTRANIIGSDQIETIRKKINEWAPRALLMCAEIKPVLWEAVDDEEVSLNRIFKKQVVALSAIGSPEGFETTLSKLGAHVTPIRFQDHHLYSNKDLDKVESIAADKNGSIVTTEKDWTKLRFTRWGTEGTRPSRLFVMKAELKFIGKDENVWSELIRKKCLNQPRI